MMNEIIPIPDPIFHAGELVEHAIYDGISMQIAEWPSWNYLAQCWEYVTLTKNTSELYMVNVPESLLRKIEATYTERCIKTINRIYNDIFVICVGRPSSWQL